MHKNLPDLPENFPRNNRNDSSKNSRPGLLGAGLALIYEDRDIIVVDKPAGLLSITREGRRERNVYGILAQYLRGKAPAVVHRLDKDTSGVMIFAKSGWVKKKLMDNWDEAVAERRYICVAEGEFSKSSGIIDLPLGEDRSGRVVAMKNGRPARTRWELLDNQDGYSLLSLELDTGRRNQILAHLAALGHPVAGDKKYWAKTDPAGRLCLHASSLAFYHPRDGKLMEFESPVPRCFERIFHLG
ncbi:MAG: RluA family pseudouridine synthase [Treponema sp.]|nr:RluA family pseudouridine synthase [Treponema sp.]